MISSILFPIGSIFLAVFLYILFYRFLLDGHKKTAKWADATNGVDCFWDDSFLQGGLLLVFFLLVIYLGCDILLWLRQ